MNVSTAVYVSLIVLIVMVGSVAYSQDSQDSQDSQAVPTVPAGETFSVVASSPIQSPAGEPPGVWNWGRLLMVEYSRSAAPVFRTFDRTGSSQRITLRINGANRINVYSDGFTSSRDGTIVAAGTAHSSDLRGASVLVLISPDGEQTVVRTAPFAVYAITVAPDGVIWTAGLETGSNPNPEHHVIMRFDSRGRLLSSVIPQRSMRVKRGHVHPAMYSHLAASLDRVGWYSGSAGVYTEFSLDGRMIGQTATPETAESTTLAVCEDASVYVGAPYQKGAEKGWGIFALQRDVGNWKFLPRPEKWGMLFGCDGRRLVAATDMKSVLWLERNEVTRSN